jgi:glucose-specific phosphotransferase system IIA component
MIFDKFKKALNGNGNSGAKLVSCPMNGEVLPLSKSSDEAHQQEMLGKGVLFIPSEGAVYAPFNGKVEMVFETYHALGLTSNDGVELIIHVGFETVKLEGKHFKVHVKENQKIKEGDLLLEFDIEGIKADGYLIETPVVVTNTDSYQSIALLADGTVSKNDRLLEIN